MWMHVCLPSALIVVSKHPFQSCVSFVHTKSSPVNPRTTILFRAQSCSKQAENSKVLTWRNCTAADIPFHPLPCGGTPGRIRFFGLSKWKCCNSTHETIEKNSQFLPPLLEAHLCLCPWQIPTHQAQMHWVHLPSFAYSANGSDRSDFLDRSHTVSSVCIPGACWYWRRTREEGMQTLDSTVLDHLLLLGRSQSTTFAHF